MEKEVVCRGQAVTTPLCYETQRETFSEVTTGFDDKVVYGTLKKKNNML